MFTGFFRDRSPAGSVHAAHSALRRVLRTQPLSAFRFDPNCEVGPFVVDYLCRERSLIVEVQRPAAAVGRDARAAFLSGMGYVVVQVSRQELRSRPGKVVRRLRQVLEDKAGGNVRIPGRAAQGRRQ